MIKNKPISLLSNIIINNILCVFSMLISCFAIYLITNCGIKDCEEENIETCYYPLEEGTDIAYYEFVKNKQKNANRDF